MPGWIVAACFCFAPVLLIVSWRWRMLLAVHGVHLAFWRIFELTMIGQFFSAFGVGTTGGDVIKIFYAARAVPQRRAAVAFTVIVDRVIGFVALLLFGVLLSISQSAAASFTSRTKAAHRHLLFLCARRRGGLAAGLHRALRDEEPDASCAHQKAAFDSPRRVALHGLRSTRPGRLAPISSPWLARFLRIFALR